MRLIVAIFAGLFLQEINPELDLHASILLGIAVFYGLFFDLHEAYYRGKLWVKNVD